MRSRSGFTLLELMVTVAIIAVLMAVAIPNLVRWRNNAQMSRGARQIYSDLQDARSMAIKHNTMVTVDFDSNTTYKIYRSGTLVASRNMPPGIQIDDAAFTAEIDGNDHIASFNNMGFARTFENNNNSGSVTISLAGTDRSCTITVNTGGSARIESE